MWQGQLEVIRKTMARFNSSLYEGATKREIELLCENLKKRMDMEIPDEYIDLLRKMDGFEFNGYILYGVDEEYTEDIVKQKYINGLIDRNEIWYENAWDGNYLFLGESSISWYVYDLDKKKYAELDNPSGDFCKYYNDFDEMLTTIFTDCDL